ncbi:MAG TPA: diguanylate cyclase, partial [Chloroflexota bacterium]|nr:diguanylate cyclase [Chloroflexota bacterium]
VSLTGGLASPFFSAFFLIVVHAGIRFGRNAALLTVGVIIICNVVLLHSVDGAGAALVLRLGFILLTALFAGILSDRTRVAEAAVADQLRRTQALHVAGAALAGTISWPDILPLVAQQARRVTAADIAILDVQGEGDGQQQVTDVVPSGAYLAKLILHHRLKAPKPQTVQAEATRSTLSEATDLFGDVVRALPPASLLRAPIMLQRRWAGDLLLVRSAGSPPFEQGDVAVLEAFVAQAGLALENAALYQRVQVQAATDSLTGLPNHRSLKERLDDEVTRAHRLQRKLTVLMLDIDYFKPFNDDYGHAAGDSALQTVAAVLKDATRRGTAIGRYGGEEFVVLLPDTDTDEGTAIARRICTYVANSAEAERSALPRRLTVSIGVATFPEHGSQRDALLQAADLAMYVAKRLGRNQVCSANELGTARGAEALVTQLTEHLPISTQEWGPHIVTALERRFLRLATLEPSADLESSTAIYQRHPITVQWVTALAAAIDAKDHYTNGHSEQVAKLAVELARATGQARELVELVQFAGQMHDIGKIGIPESILHKPGTLTAEEWAIMRVHPNIGARILSPIATLQSAIPIVLHHHERWDGQGYPDGLAGEAIPLGARMIAICDAFDTMVSDRPYRRALSDEDALGRLRSSAGSQFDPRLVEAFVSLADVQEDLASAVSR